MRVFGTLVVQNEGDIIDELLNHLRRLEVFDAIFLYDLGSSDDTWERALAHRDLFQVARQIDEPYSNVLRYRLMMSHRDLYAPGDWIALIDADELYEENPRTLIPLAEEERADSIWALQALFYLTDRDLEQIASEDFRRPIRERRRFYAVDWSEARFHRYYGAWQKGPREVNPCSHRFLNRHYQFRTPGQVHLRLQTRIASRSQTAGLRPYRHVPSADWRDYVMPSRLLHEDLGDRLHCGLPAGVMPADYEALPRTSPFHELSQGIAECAMLAAAPQVNPEAPQLLELGVKRTRAGVGFNHQPNGEWGLWFRASGISDGIVALLDEVPLRTLAAEPGIVTASVPEELVQRPGEYEIRLCNRGALSDPALFRVEAWPADSSLVSVVIPCFNHARYLREAIGSVAAQSYPRWEIVVVDDGSTDETSSIANGSAPVRYIHQQHGGVAAARNLGLAHSAGEFIVFLDADDRLLPGSLAAGVFALIREPDAAVAYGFALLIESGGFRIPTPQQKPLDDDHYLALLRNNTLWNPALAMYRRQAVDAADGYRPRAGASSHYDLNLRLARRTRFVCHNQHVLEYRREHPENGSRIARAALRNAVFVRRMQRRLLSGRRRERAAWKDGILKVQARYGQAVARGLARSLRERDFGNALMSAGALTAYYPAGLLLAMRELLGLSGGRRRRSSEVLTNIRPVEERVARERRSRKA
jgi:glycosyltransferase involved in cell wall biosynthesis